MVEQSGKFGDSEPLGFILASYICLLRFLSVNLRDFPPDMLVYQGDNPVKVLPMHLVLPLVRFAGLYSIRPAILHRHRLPVDLGSFTSYCLESDDLKCLLLTSSSLKVTSLCSQMLLPMLKPQKGQLK